MDQAPRLSDAPDASWLFSSEIYCASNPDLTGFARPYDHYIAKGDREGRTASLFFDPHFYLSQLDSIEAAAAAREGPCQHFLRRLPGAAPRTSRYFDPEWYLRRYPAVAMTIRSGAKTGALHHYLTNDRPTEFDPLPQFSERFYLARYPDVAEAVAATIWRNGYLHFLNHGVFELRSPSPQIDLRHYVAGRSEIRADLDLGRARDAFTHYLSVDPEDGPATDGLAGALPSRQQAPELFRLRVETIAAAAVRRPLDFSCVDPPVLSAVMVVHNQLAAALMSLASLRAGSAGPIELLLIDAGSQDDTRFIDRYVNGATMVRLEAHLGRLPARNAVVGCATANTILLLEPGVELAPGALQAGLERLRSDETAGAAGGKVIRADGRLHSAGGMVFRDGSTAHYLENCEPIASEAEFVRDVDFCPGLFLLIRAALLNRIGFDAAFAGGGEEVDLCLGIRAAGYRVVYDPAIAVWSQETANVPDIATLLRSKHVDYLRLRPTPSNTGLYARSAATDRKRILFIDDAVPLRIAGSGFVRSNDLIAAMTAMGFAVTVYPLAALEFSRFGSALEFAETVEIVRNGAAARLGQFLRERASFFDVLWVARTHNLELARSALEEALGDRPRPLLVLDTEAIAAIRDAERARVAQQPFDMEAALAAEFRHAEFCQHIVAVSQREAEILRCRGLTNITVIGHMREVRLTGRRFADRSGMLFVGAIHETGSPNHDGLCWFIDEILPLVEQELGWQTRLTVAGYLAPGISLEGYRNHPRVTLRGPVTDITPLYDSHLVFVAPTRFAAGAPYKIHEAASFGLPIVATDVLNEQLEWQGETDILVAGSADPVEFSRQLVRLQRDEILWQRLRASAAARIANENGQEQYREALRNVLGSPLRSPAVPSGDAPEPVR